MRIAIAGPMSIGKGARKLLKATTLAGHAGTPTGYAGIGCEARRFGEPGWPVADGICGGAASGESPKRATG